jgi:acyl-CoA thioester hydrolase
VKPFDWPVRVYYEDTDAGGVVYHAGYLRFFERGRTEWLRSLGYSQARLVDDKELLFTVAEISIRFRRPARLDDLLTVRTRALPGGGATVNFEQLLLLELDAGPLATAQVRVACIEASSFRPRRLPAELLREIA